ncbi:MAG: hypothetical protein ACYDBS_09470, partial [Acidimicrobiales bacterium]
MSDGTTDRPGTGQAGQDQAWMAPVVDRRERARESSERQALEGWLDFHRDTLLWKCSGSRAHRRAAEAAAGT